MQRNILKLLIITLFIPVLVSPARSDESGEIENLRRRLEKLEARETGAEGFYITEGLKTLKIWGALEVEASYLDVKDRSAESDINVGTALLGLDAAINDRVGGRIALLHEDSGEPEVALDEAHLSVSWPEVISGAFTVTGGRNYLPFGVFNSSMVSDPLTLELGETNKTALLVSWGNNKGSLQAGVYNGDYDVTGHDVIDNGVLALTYSPNGHITMAASYICDLAETGAELLGDAATPYEENVKAAGASLAMDFSSITINLEYLGALKNFSDAILADPDRAPGLTGPKPRAWFAEVGYSPYEDWAFSGRYEQARDFQDDVARYGVTASYGLYDNTVLSLEYLYSDFDRNTEKTAGLVTAQLALEF